MRETRLSRGNGGAARGMRKTAALEKKTNKEEEDLLGEESAHSPVISAKADEQNKQHATSSRRGLVKKQKEDKTWKDNADIIEDEEVLRIIGELEREVVDAFPELNETNETKQSDAEKPFVIEPKCNIEPSKDKKIEISLENHKEKKKPLQAKEVGGLINHGPYSRILFVGDSRLQSLEDFWPEYPFVKPQFLVEPNLKLEELKDFILSRTELPHLENGTLLICNVGLHDIIELVDYSECASVKNHQPVKIMTLSAKAVEDIIKIVLFRLSKIYKVLEEILDSSSVICFSAIIPCDPIMHFVVQSINHLPRGHASMGSRLRASLNELKSKVKIICTRVNKHLEKLSPMPSIWNIMKSYHLDRNIGEAFVDGINVSSETSRLLASRLNRFLLELFYGMEINTKFVEFNRDQKVILVGDSRLTLLQEMWQGDKPEFYCEPNLGFYNFSKFINEKLVDLKQKIVIVCLGLNDLIQFVDNESCLEENHEPCQVALSICDRYSSTDEYFKKIQENFKSSLTLFCTKNPVMMFFATVYPIHIDNYMNSQVKIHKEKTGHVITPPQKELEVNERLNELVYRLNSLIKEVCHEHGLPLWDMFHVVCRGYEASTLSPDVLKDGIYPSERTAEELTRSFFSFTKDKLSQEFAENVEGYKFPFRPLPTSSDYPTNHLWGKKVDTKLSTEKTQRGVDQSTINETEVNIESSSQSSGAVNYEKNKTLKEEKKGPTKGETKLGISKHPEGQKHGDHRQRHSPETSYPQERSHQPNTDSTSISSNPVHRRFSHKDDRPSVFTRIKDRRPRSEERRYPLPSPERHPYLEEKRYPMPSQEKHRRSEERRYPLPSPERRHRGSEERRYSLPSPERRHRLRTSRSPKHGRRSRSPLHRRRSRSPLYRDRSWSPRYRGRSRFSRSPERHHRKQRSPDRGRENRESLNLGKVPWSKTSSALEPFTESVRRIRKKCQMEKDPIFRDALLDLFNTHVHECELYLYKPDAHPDYSKEYRLFLVKKRASIMSLGGDPESFDYLKEWERFWPSRMFELFQESWEAKKTQCLSMMTSKRKRPSSSMSSSRSPTPERRRKRSKKKASKPEKSFPKPEKKKVFEGNNKWKPMGSPEDTSDSDFMQDMVLTRHDPEKLIETSAQSVSLPFGEKVSSQNVVKKKVVNVVEVLGILAYMKEKLGVYGLPVSIMYEKAVEMEKKGLNPNALLEDEETATLFAMLSDKLSSQIEEGDGSTIQKAITLEAHTLLLDLITEINEIKKKHKKNLPVNIAQIARLTIGKTISDTIMLIKNFLEYEGYSNVSKDALENIYMSVKDEQLKLTESTSSSQNYRSVASPSGFTRTDQKTVESKRPSQGFTNFVVPQDKLNEEFFIGKNSFSSRDVGLSKPAIVKASTSKFDTPEELDEEFFTGRKFLKPSGFIDNERNEATFKSTYVPHKHKLPPPAPIISGIRSSVLLKNSSSQPGLQLSQNASSQLLRNPSSHLLQDSNLSLLQNSANKPSSASSVPKGLPEAVDFDLLRKCLAALPNFPK
ncbi:uncharacterized protein LOC135213552 [Macrobrachium nipponense]|uniref:uncharacterized protein LOC135213552 n=1 Tax=Macrobrachium nipponense TaxID=159736 RepID=UPI0030C7A7E9